MSVGTLTDGLRIDCNGSCQSRGRNACQWSCTHGRPASVPDVAGVAYGTVPPPHQGIPHYFNTQGECRVCVVIAERDAYRELLADLGNPDRGARCHICPK